MAGYSPEVRSCRPMFEGVVAQMDPSGATLETLHDTQKKSYYENIESIFE